MDVINVISTNSPLNKLKLNKALYEMMWTAKEEHMIKVAKAFEVTDGTLKETLYKLLTESNMNMGACNVATGFLITVVEKEEHGKYPLNQEIRNQILNSAIYYANGLGLDPN